MDRFHKIVAVTFIITQFVLIWTLVNSTELCAQGEKPLIPVTVTVKAQFPIEQKLQDKLVGITEDLIRKNLSEILVKSFSVKAETNIIKRTPKGYIVEILVMSLFKETFTAQMSRIEFAYEDGKVTIWRVEQSYQPK
jgi:hypothetical protein